jgi:hypothetical protein
MGMGALVSGGGNAQAQQQHSASDVESAREAFKEGRRLREAGDLKGALEKFKAAHALGRTPVTGIELAKTYADLGMPVEGREICLDIERTPVAPQETQRSQDARKEGAILKEQLKTKIASLTLHVKGAPQGMDPVVTVDGVAVPAVALTEPRKLNPGHHEIAAHVSTGPEAKGSVDLKEGESKDLDIIVMPPPTPPPPEKKTSPLVPVGIAMAGTGLVVGSIAGVVTLSKKGSLDTECPNKSCPPGTPTGDLHSTQTWGNVTTVSWVVAGVGVGVLVAGVMMSRASGSTTGQGTTAPPQNAKVEPYIGVGAAGIHGTF